MALIRVLVPVSFVPMLLRDIVAVEPERDTEYETEFPPDVVPELPLSSVIAVPSKVITSSAPAPVPSVTLVTVTVMAENV